ncbi:hypothetical protein TNCT_337751 [Trichonephila clavata]|uniref:Uncharacterized protein n=1 Tax=Trichonephila clavata TaxID=2740835 RepID=A0A8X6L4J5_TRICU|nr:hypothetical protein TNCT_337751 [Trichonephila clavata]
MEDKKVLYEYGGKNENDFGRTYVTLEPISSRRRDAFESFQNECRPIAYDESSNYSLQIYAKNCSLPMQDNWGETEVSDWKQTHIIFAMAE